MKQVFRFIIRIQYMNQARHLFFYEPSNWSEQKKRSLDVVVTSPESDPSKRVMLWSSQRRNAQHLFGKRWRKVTSTTGLKIPGKTSHFWTIDPRYETTCVYVTLCQSCQSHPLIVSMGRIKGKGWQVILICASTKPTHQRFDLAHSPWHSCQAKSEVLINETSNSWRLRSEQFYGG